LAEQETLNLKVEGSTPSEGAKNVEVSMLPESVLVLGKRLNRVEDNPEHATYEWKNDDLVISAIYTKRGSDRNTWEIEIETHDRVMLLHDEDRNRKRATERIESWAKLIKDIS
jgi:hypothetical protein